MECETVVATMTTTTTAVLPRRSGKGSGREGEGPPKSFSMRQRKMGPAPMASMDSIDLSDVDDSSPPDLGKVIPMPEIKEDATRTPDEETGTSGTGLQFGKTTIITTSGYNNNVVSTTTVMTSSGPTSALQTPSTPRIDISCASSSTPPSESNSDKDLFPGGLGLGFSEDGGDDLRSSTEELEYGAEDELHDRKNKQKSDFFEDALRRASHPANIFNQRKASLTPTEEDLMMLQRKPSTHSLYLEGFLAKPCRHSSFGSNDRVRPGAFSSLSYNCDGRRSASPNKMRLETSFCGSRPIPTKSMDIDSPPKPKFDGPFEVPAIVKKKPTSRSNNSGMLSSDSSFEGGHKPQKLTATVQVHNHESSTIHEGNSDANKNQLPPSSSSPDDTDSPTLNINCRIIKQHPHLQSPDSPKSSDCWKPLSRPITPRPVSPRPPEHREPSVDSSPVTASPSPAGQVEDLKSKTPPRPERKFFPESFQTPQQHQPQEASFQGASSQKPQVAPVPQVEPSSLPQHQTESSPAPVRRSPRPQRYKEESMELIQPHKVVLSAAVHKVDSSPSSVRSSPKPQRYKEESMELIQRVSLKSLGKTSAIEDPAHPVTPKTKRKPIAQEIEAFEVKWPEPELELEIRAHLVGVTTFKPSSIQERKLPSPPREAPPKKPVDPPAPPPPPNVPVPVPTGQSPTRQPATTTTTTTTSTQDREVKFQEDDEDKLPSLDDVPIETKGFFQDSMDEDDDLPYVPTTLPVEKSAALPIMPIRERQKLGKLVETKPIQRPRSVRPPNPKALDEFVAAANSGPTKSPTPVVAQPSSSTSSTTSKPSQVSSSSAAASAASGDTKMKINLPRDDSIPENNSPVSKNPKSKLPTSWADFAEMGLRSPREIRKQQGSSVQQESTENSDPPTPAGNQTPFGATTDDVTSYQSDSCWDDEFADREFPLQGRNEEDDEETEALLKLPKVPFAMDLDVKSNRSSGVSQEVHSPSTSAQPEEALEEDDEEERLSIESP